MKNSFKLGLLALAIATSFAACKGSTSSSSADSAKMDSAKMDSAKMDVEDEICIYKAEWNGRQKGRRVFLACQCIDDDPFARIC